MPLFGLVAETLPAKNHKWNCVNAALGADGFWLRLISLEVFGDLFLTFNELQHAVGKHTEVRLRKLGIRADRFAFFRKGLVYH